MVNTNTSLKRTATVILKTKCQNSSSEMKNGKSAKPLNLLCDEKERDTVYEVTFMAYR